MVTVVLKLKDGMVIETDLDAGGAITTIDRMIRNKVSNSDINILQPDGSPLVVKSDNLEKIEIKF